MTASRWALGLSLVGLLVLAYVGAIRPLRVLFVQAVAQPVFSHGAEVRSGEIRLEVRGAYVEAAGPGVDERSGADVAIYKTPLGARPMLGVLVLALLYPRRRWWLLLAVSAILEGGLTTLFFAAGTDGFSGAFVMHRVVQAVLNDTLPLAFPALVFLLHRAAYFPDP